MLLVAFALSAITLTVFRADLGVAIDATAIRNALGGVRTTRHFEILYPKALPRDVVDRLAEDHEFRYAQLAAIFGKGPNRIRSYIFADMDQKRRLLGAARVFIAKPWRREVYLQAGGFPHRVLKHELAHVFAGRFGDPLFHVSFRWRPGPLGIPLPHFNVGLIEGLAVAMDWRPSGELDEHQRAAALFALKLAPPIEGLFGLGFFAQAGPRAYTLAGSFCRFLLKRYGISKLATVYRNAGDFDAAYHESLPTLIGQWRSFLATRHVPKRQLALTEARYRRPSILRRICAHEMANIREEVHKAAAAGDFDRATALLTKIARFDPKNPAHLIALMRAKAAARGPAAGLVLASRVLAHSALSQAQRRRVLEDIGDWRYLSRDIAAATKAYAKASDLPAGPGDRRMLALERWALR
ncbi:MAG: hypothetical protein KAI47_24770, partial [Deltaproteobacteria bacterium]|nr:hypothetical protein [Deltaproteobacteria bacterium]